MPGTHPFPGVSKITSNRRKFFTSPILEKKLPKDIGNKNLFFSRNQGLGSLWPTLETGARKKKSKSELLVELNLPKCNTGPK